MLTYRTITSEDSHALVSLFSDTFTAAEGEEEGQLLARLARALSQIIDNTRTFCFGAQENGELTAALFFTGLQFSEPVSVYMLAPVAVATERQGEGIGQALIRFGLDALQARGVDVVVTYGDPAYYSKSGFEPLPETVIEAPMPLSMPHGWQGLSLSGEVIPELKSRPACVEPFRDPVYW